MELIGQVAHMPPVAYRARHADLAQNLKPVQSMALSTY